MGQRIRPAQSDSAMTESCLLNTFSSDYLSFRSVTDRYHSRALFIIFFIQVIIFFNNIFIKYYFLKYLTSFILYRYYWIVC